MRCDAPSSASQPSLLSRLLLLCYFATWHLNVADCSLVQYSISHYKSIRHPPSVLARLGHKIQYQNMAPSRAVEETYPPPLSPSGSEQLRAAIKDWSIAHGLAVRPPPSLVAAEADPHGILATTAPVTLFPSPFPKACFEQAKSIQKAYNNLYASIAQSEDFLQEMVHE